MRERGTIFQAWLETPDSGVIELARDWFGTAPPLLALDGGSLGFKTLRPAPPILFSTASGYYVNNRRVLHFLLDTARLEGIEWEQAGVFVACEASGWGEARNRPEWRLAPVKLGGRVLLDLARPIDELCQGGRVPFKFLSGAGDWIEPAMDAPNAVRDPSGARNLEVDPDRTGRHRFVFETEAPVDLSESLFVVWRDEPGAQRVPLRPDGFFLRLASDAPLGARVDGGETEFRVFAPRAGTVLLRIHEHPDSAVGFHEYPMHRADDGTWDLRLDENLNGWFYGFRVAGPANCHGAFDGKRLIVDPYARALVSRDGPGIILEDSFFEGADTAFPTPRWQDLVISEIHVRDIVANAPLALTDGERRGFSGLTRWVSDEAFYLRKLGVNAVELQPVQEFDSVHSDEYHWGYMPVNWFAPESSYASSAADASQVGEFRDLVRAFHDQGIAVILDVVYNHVGVPEHLMFLDKHYYFENDSEGRLANWSGCGNDLRASAPMATRLIIDSCVHLIRAYGIDGFRFDLAELLGVETLRKIEAALKEEKPDVILIAEPWSFRWHIAGALGPTGWASWNDGYRDFIRDYIRGKGTRDGIEYYLKGSPWYFARWPAQTVNYAESHDDRTWLDVITENADGSGENPTENDRLRTHLMCAILMVSVGIPMLAAGQDFLRSKKGVTNTYQRGDLNALDYRRMAKFVTTHRYFSDWIRFRLSDRGRLSRLFTRPGDGFFQFSFVKESSSAAVVFNADGSHGSLRMLFAVNPQDHEVLIPAEDFPVVVWRQLADAERFFETGEGPEPTILNNGIHLPRLGCALWIAG